MNLKPTRASVLSILTHLLGCFPLSISNKPRKRQTWKLTWMGRRKIFPILHLPLEILFEITSWLPPVSKLCLALTCKTLLSAIDPSETLRQSRDFKIIQSSPDAYAVKDGFYCSQRWQFMRLLERDTRTNPRWRCCFDCFKLHRVGEFPSKVRNWGFSRSCGRGVATHSFVRLCPCWRLTVWDMQRIFGILNKKARQGTTTGSSQLLLHECSHKYNSSRVELKISARLLVESNNHNPQRLLLETAFEVFGESLPDSVVNVPQPICPDIKLPVYLQDFGRAHFSRYGPSPAQYREKVPCGYCSTSLVGLDCYTNNPRRPYRHCSFRAQKILVNEIPPTVGRPYFCIHRGHPWNKLASCFWHELRPGRNNWRTNQPQETGNSIFSRTYL